MTVKYPIYLSKVKHREAKEALKKIQAEFCTMCEELHGKKDPDYCLYRCEWHDMFNLILNELNGC